MYFCIELNILLFLQELNNEIFTFTELDLFYIFNIKNRCTIIYPAINNRIFINLMILRNFRMTPGILKTL